MFQFRVNLVFEFVTVNRGATTAGASRIARLNHEVWNYAMEDYAVVVAALGKRCEVLAGFRRVVVVDLDGYRTLQSCEWSRDGIE